MSKNWTKFRDHYCEMASKTAKITSQNPKVLEQRSLQLKNWRDKNPDLFYNLCVSKMVAYRTSKPEKNLTEWILLNFSDLDFKGNQRLKHSSFTTMTQYRQIDILSKKNKIIVEFDGIVHFRNVTAWNQLPNKQKTDKEINELINDGFLVIRISADNWLKDKQFLEESLSQTKNILINYKENQGKLFRIGKLYV